MWNGINPKWLIEKQKIEFGTLLEIKLSVIHWHNMFLLLNFDILSKLKDIQGCQKYFYKYGTWLSGLDARSLCLKSFLFDLSSPSVCGILMGCLSGSQMNTVAPGRLPDRLLLKILHTDGGETSSRNDFNHRRESPTTEETPLDRKG